jgi:hypothetical protein
LGTVDFLAKPVITPILRAKVGVFVGLFNARVEIKRLDEHLRELEHEAQERKIADERRRWIEESAGQRKAAEEAG